MNSTGVEADAARLESGAKGSMAVKRIVDLLAAATLLILCLPVIVVTAFIVYFALGRPLMFRQERAGRGMRPFRIGKFRTMTDTRDDKGRLLPDNLRQLPVTVFLRRIRVDELPQLFSVIRGDMSFIGPRPLPVATLRDFGERGHARCTVRPGMTGWAQVNGNTLLTPEQKIALDIWYVDRHNLMLDIRIILMTVRTIVMGEKIDQPNLAEAQLHLWRREAFNSSLKARA